MQVSDDLEHARSAALLAGQNQALQLAVAGAPLPEVLESIARTAESQSDGGILCSILLLDEDGRRLRHGAAPSLPQEYNEAIDGVEIGPGVGSCGTAAFLGQAVEVTDIASDPLWADFRTLALRHDLHACWSTPLHATSGAVLGTFAMYYRSPRGPSEHDRRVVELLSNTAALILERHLQARERNRMEASLRQQADMMALVAQASQVLHASLSAEEIADRLTQQARAIIGAHQAVTSLTISDDWAQSINAVSLSDRYAAWRDYGARPTGAGIYAEVCRTNRPLRLTQEQLVRHPAWKGFGAHAAEHPPMRGYLAAPLVGQTGRNLGLVQLSDKEEGDFTDADESVLVQLAAIAAIGIENARLYTSLRETNQRKDEFLATLAHELRNPLAPLGNALTLLRRGRTPDEGAKLLAIMERQMKQMVHLVDDLLDVSRVTTGKVVLRLEPTDVREIVDVALETSLPQIRASGHTLDVRLPAEPLPLRGDKARLAQVLVNLLNNAAKYTPENGHIELSAHAQEGKVHIRVKDTGIGIPPDMLPRIFEIFTQVHQSLERAQGGLGLGLALVQKLAQMHGGDAWAHSAGPGQGSTFTVELPMAPAVAEPAAAPLPAPAARPRSGFRVLVVDDNVDAAESLAMLLQLSDHETLLAHNGPDAVELARRVRPDVVFLDIGLPGMNGYEVARALRAEQELASTALIALTGWGTERDQQAARESGFDFHLTKPAASDKVEALLTQVRQRGAAQSTVN